MTARRTRRRGGWIGPVTAGLIAGLVLGGGAPAALAHDALVDSLPAEGATVSTLDTVALTFSDSLLNLAGIDNAFVIQVVGPDGRYYGNGCTQLTGAVISTDIAAGAAGEYTVQWQVVSADGHPISDSYAFDYEPAAGAGSAAGLTEAPVCGAEPGPGPASETAAPGGEGSTDAAAGGLTGLQTGLLIGGGVAAAAGLATALLIGRTRRAE